MQYSIRMTAKHVRKILKENVPMLSHHEEILVFIDRWAKWFPKTIMSGAPVGNTDEHCENEFV